MHNAIMRNVQWPLFTGRGRAFARIAHEQIRKHLHISEKSTIFAGFLEITI